MKPLHWVGPSLRDLRKLPAVAQDQIAHALYLAQMGGTHADVVAVKGFKATGAPDVLEYRGDGAARAVYIVLAASGVYVLHAGHSTASAGKTKPSAAAATDLELIRRRLADAIADAMGGER
jgi:phage-related protein